MSRSPRRRLSRRVSFGAFGANPTAALLRMGALLIVLGLIYSWAKKPQSWRWLETGPDASATEEDGFDGALAQADPATDEGKAVPSPAPEHETLVPGATDLDKAEWDKSAMLFEAVSDKTVLAPEEMSAYWRCMKWARAQTFADIDRRAARDVAYTKLFEEPEKYRGKLLRLRLHILRILDWDAHENSAAVKHVYEAWGWTDQSNALYVTVFSELPEGMKLGTGQHQEGVFVGYFLKDMAFQEFNHKKGAAPLLVGRMQRIASAAPAPLIAKSDRRWLWMLAIPFVAIGIVSAWLRLRSGRRATVVVPSPANEAEVEEWFRSEGNASPTGSADAPRHDAF
jgi:hypothetical protein